MQAKREYVYFYDSEDGVSMYDKEEDELPDDGTTNGQVTDKDFIFLEDLEFLSEDDPDFKFLNDIMTDLGIQDNKSTDCYTWEPNTGLVSKIHILGDADSNNSIITYSNAMNRRRK